MQRVRMILLACCCLTVIMARAQQAVALAHYVFPSFVKGTVWQKDGSKNEAMLNYNALSREMIFETAPGQYLALATPEKTDTVFIQDRKFVPVNREFYELLTPLAIPLFVQYTCSIKEPGTDIGYGMSSSTLPSPAVKSLIKRGGAYSLRLPDGFEAGMLETYWLYTDGKWQKANTAKQLLAAIPEKKDQVNALIKKNHTSFSNRNNIIELIQQLK